MADLSADAALVDSAQSRAASTMVALETGEVTVFPGATLVKDGRTLYVEAGPDAFVNADGVTVGVQVWVRLYDEMGVEVPVDPHRVFVNPPGYTYDELGNLFLEPSLAFYEILWASVDGNHNEDHWIAES